MYLVSGIQRTGSSLIMNMANEAGFPVYGKKFPKDWEQTRTEKSKDNQQNPSVTGFWESMANVDAGVNNQTTKHLPNRVRNHFIKIFAVGIPRTDLAYIDKVILCVRNWRKQVQSWRKVFIYNVFKNTNVKIDDLKYPYGVEYCIKYAQIIFDYVKRNYEMITIDFDELISKPTETCDNIRGFIGCGRWDLARKLVDSTHNHHKKEKPISQDKEFKEGFFSFMDRLYLGLKSGKLPPELIRDVQYWNKECRSKIDEINEEWDIAQAEKEKEAANEQN